MSITIVEHIALWPVRTLDDATLRGLRGLGLKWLEKNANTELLACEEYAEAFKGDIEAHEKALAAIDGEIQSRAKP